MDKTTELKVNVSGKRSSEVGTNEYERKIDPLAFPMDAEWMQYEPVTPWQRKTKELFLDAKAKGRLHSFTCMAIDPAIVDGKLVYQKGLQPAVGYSRGAWERLLKEYDPSRNSRQLAETEYACRNLYIIGKLVEEKKWESQKAWYAVCDDSREIASHCYIGDEQMDPVLTGNGEICGFYDLGSTLKMIAQDPWNLANYRSAYKPYFIFALPHCENPYRVFAVAQTIRPFGGGANFDSAIALLAMD